MKYEGVISGIFLSRPNRFVAQVMIEGKEETVHVKNTGRCRELLIYGAVVYLQYRPGEHRKTQYDLIAVEKGPRLVQVDSQAPNQIFREWVEQGNWFPNITLVKAETTYGNSRFDFYVETKDSKGFVEVKGATLEENGVVRFPDAPTERGVKHVEELIKCVGEGYFGYVVFIIQMEGVAYFTPHDARHLAFGNALRHAQKQGVQLLALDCKVRPEEITAKDLVEIRL